ncbi:MAG TPA: DUF4145 domain-containing protein [Pedobacter sp.]|jgi:hypothetical protein
MTYLDDHLKIERCPHCSIDQPNLFVNATFNTTNDRNANTRLWKVYSCKRCGGVVTAWAYDQDRLVKEVFPLILEVSNVLPSKVKAYLQQAIDSTSAPAGSVMLCASAVDAMLKEFGYKEGSLYKRIEKATSDHLITSDMAKWAHYVRLDANDQRHADDNADLPTVSQATKVIEFTRVLADILFVMPYRITEGLSVAENDDEQIM